MNLLKKSELKELFDFLENYYGIDKNFLQIIKNNYEFYSNKEGKIYIFPRKVNIEFHKLGLYIIKKEKNGYRFSIEGAQLFGPYARNRILEINKEKIFYKKENLNEIKVDVEDGYYILKDGKDFLGSCYVKNKILKDFIPDNRKIVYIKL